VGLDVRILAGDLDPACDGKAAVVLDALDRPAQIQGSLAGEFR